MNIIKLAQEAELLKEDGTEPYRWSVEHLQHFAELVLEAAPREWIDITDGELFDLWMKSPAETEDRFAFVRKALAMQKERNT